MEGEITDQDCQTGSLGETIIPPTHVEHHLPNT